MTPDPESNSLLRRLRAAPARLWTLAERAPERGRLAGASLATKTQLLFGAAAFVLIAAALLVPWVRLSAVVDASQLETSRRLARLFDAAIAEGASLTPLFGPPAVEPGEAAARPRIRRYTAEQFEDASKASPFLAAAITRFREPPVSRRAADEHFEAYWTGGDRLYLYADAERDPATTELIALTFVERRSPQAEGLLLLNRVYVIVAGAGAWALAVVLFHVLTTRIFLSPVRKLRRTADAVREGDLSIRSSLATGDEFEDLSDAFNAMLDALLTSQEALSAANQSLDLRVHELARSNVALNEANQVKAEFLANVSHELRTPLNSIIGFAELLQSIVVQESSSPVPDDIRIAARARRERYLDNIITAGRSLLEMINELLEMARIEAGKVQLRIEPMAVPATCEALLAMIRPQAERSSITLNLDLPPAETPLPVVWTDHRKFQQIIFNFLSNAVKFTPDLGAVTLRAESLTPPVDNPIQRIRVSVIDTGPGIREEDQQVIFEKFRQLESSHTRSAGGTGLGLAIARELAAALSAEIQLVSSPGAGSMFSLIVPVSPPGFTPPPSA